LVSINGHDGKAAFLDENGSVLMIHINEGDQKLSSLVALARVLPVE
jgi:hypothetical protein